MGTATKVQCGERLCVLDLIVAGASADLFCRIEKHSHPGGADGMSSAYQSAAGVDRQPTAHLDLAVFDGLPRFAGAGQPDVIDGQIFTGGEAVMDFDPVEVVEGDLGAPQRVEHRGSYVRQQVGSRVAFACAVEFLP